MKSLLRSGDMNRELVDRIYAKPRDQIHNFVFDQEVADVFDDMIKRSVPGYSSIINMIGCLAEQFVVADSRCYDLGCSLGSTTLSMRDRINRPGVKIIAVDNSEAMINKCRSKISGSESGTTVELICDDIQNIKIEQASLVVLNFTLQFIDQDKRADLLQRIYDGLLKGGALVISEKIAFEDSREQAFQENLHYTFKKLNGYTDLEISQKRMALEKILVADTLGEHRDRLQSVGFDHTKVWFQCFNFASMIALKK